MYIFFLVCVRFKNRGSQLFLMPLEVLTIERNGELISKFMEALFGNSRNEYISGFIHTPEGSTDNHLQPKEITLVTEVSRSKSFGIMARALAKLGCNLEGMLDTGPIYLAKTHYLYHPFERATLNSDVQLGEDLRYMIFGSRKFYKFFLRALDQQKLSESISETEYLGVIKRVGHRFKNMYCELGNTPFLYARQTLREFREVFENDPLISPYLRMAKEIVQSQK